MNIKIPNSIFLTLYDRVNAYKANTHIYPHKIFISKNLLDELTKEVMMFYSTKPDEEVANRIFGIPFLTVLEDDIIEII